MFNDFLEYFKGIVNRPEVVERFKICGECEHFKKETVQCDVCGCYMSAKVQIPIASCPAGKW